MKSLIVYLKVFVFDTILFIKMIWGQDEFLMINYQIRISYALSKIDDVKSWTVYQMILICYRIKLNFASLSAIVYIKRYFFYLENFTVIFQNFFKFCIMKIYNVNSVLSWISQDLLLAQFFKIIQISLI